MAPRQKEITSQRLAAAKAADNKGLPGKIRINGNQRRHRGGFEVVIQKAMEKKTPWYVAGLYFECVQCGRCCSGPAEGYIWVSRPEVERIADYLKITPGQLRQNYLKRIGLRTTIIERAGSKDCIFLQEGNGPKKCMIYPVRTSQCRSWPFWPGNLTSSGAWNKAAQRCGGINRGRLYSFEEIEKIKKAKKWWQETEQTIGS